MHETSLVMNAIKLVVQDATRRRLTRITRIDLEVGELSGAYPHALRESFPIASKGSIAQDAELVITEIPATMHCSTCSTSFNPTISGWVCPSCGSAAKGSIAQDAELVITEIPATMHCSTCSTSFNPTISGWVCPSCGSGDCALIRGMELQVVSYTGEEDPDEHQSGDWKGTS
jgi:hydrogenase nickel incorporation protein HypA/HybF